VGVISRPALIKAWSIPAAEMSPMSAPPPVFHRQGRARAAPAHPVSHTRSLPPRRPGAEDDHGSPSSSIALTRVRSRCGTGVRRYRF